MKKSDKKTADGKNEELIEQAKKFYEDVQEKQTDMREKGTECMEFVAGEQWSLDDIKHREADERPRITINKLAPFVNQVTNKHAQGRNRIKALAYEEADSKTGRVINGLVRHIQFGNLSHAEVAYRKAYSDAVTSGYGFWRVSTVYLDENSFEQEIIIEQIEDINSVYMNQDDDDECLITEWLSKDDFEEKYPDAEIVNWDDNTEETHEWVTEDAVAIAEYWVREKTLITIYKISYTNENNEQEIIVVNKEELDLFEEGEYELLQERETEEIKVKQYIMSADEILEENEWAGKYIPIIGIYGRKFTVNGKMFYKSLVYDALDGQRIYNFYRSEEAELLSKQPKAPWVGAEGQFDGHEEEFQYANLDSNAYLEYKPVTVDGHAAPPPSRQQPPPIASGYVQAVNQATDEIKSTIGMYDASLGNQGQEQSGRAILARQQQGDISTDHFNQSFNEGLKKTGLVLVDLIRFIYDTERTIRILGDDMEEEVVQINQGYTDKEGKPVMYDLTTGKYDIRIVSGASASTRKIETAENLLEFARTIPNAAGAVGDLIAQNMEFDNSDELSNRLKAMIDPQIFARMKQLEEEEKTGVNQTQQQMQQMNQMNQQLVQQLQQSKIGTQQLMQKTQQLQKESDALRKNNKMLESQTKIKVAKINSETDIREEQIRRSADLEIQQLKSRTELQKQSMQNLQ
jgi:hypothetical protein